HAADALVRAGRLLPVLRGVYQVGPLPQPHGLEAAALLAAGAGTRLSHRSGARLHGLVVDGCRVEGPRHSRRAKATNPIVEVSVPRKRRRRIEEIRIHRVRDLREDEVMELDGLRVTTPARTVLDLGEVMSEREV